MRWTGFGAVAVLAVGMLVGARVEAQQYFGGPPGSPSGRVFPDSRQLPLPTPPFTGTITPNVVDSTPAWPPQVSPPDGAPNVLLILTDDVGFGAVGTFGGVVPTPTLDRIANNGLRYTAFHTTALCSPTRAALLTGRNHHQVGFGDISELSGGFPGYNSIIPPETAHLAQTLRLNGYATSWFGKNHNVPSWEASPAGPFTNWPIMQGYDYFYGFVGGDTSQWQPGNLFRNTTPIHPYNGKPGWNLGTAMADDAIEYLHLRASVAPRTPWFMHYAPGGTHAPHHPPPEWVEKFRGRFDGGWEKLRQEIYANQKRLGVIPANAQLPAWPDFLPTWESLTAEERKLYARQVEVYAAYLAYTDHEIGRVVQAVEDLGQLDNTIIIYISGDNGSSAEGSMHGTPNEVAYFNGVEIPVDVQMKWYDVWGTDQTYNHMGVPWTWAFGTPYRWTKQVASHLGGTRNGMAISWPKHIADKGGMRTQFHHVIDIAPTVLDMIGIPQPNMVNGVAQRPMDGVSMTYSFPKAAEATPSTHQTQYFEILGNRALYHEGWMASTTPAAPPWDAMAPRPVDTMNGWKWELYNLVDDPTQVNDLAAKEPGRLRDLQDLFIMEATRNQVFPLSASITAMINPRPGPAAGLDRFVYTAPVSAIQANAAPSILNRSYRITAEIEVPQGGANGMLVTQGGRFSGWGLYLVQGKPVFTMNLLNLERVRWEGTTALAPGKHIVVFDFVLEPKGAIPFGHGGTGVLSVDGQTLAERSMPKTLPFTFAWDETFDVGLDTGTPVDDRDYQVPFAFTGTLVKLTFDLGKTTATLEAFKEFMAEMAKRSR